MSLVDCFGVQVMDGGGRVERIGKRKGERQGGVRKDGRMEGGREEERGR